MTRLMHPDSPQEIETLPGSERIYLANGWRVVEEGAPKGNASLAAWQEYARAKGFTDADIEGKTRAELRAALG